MSLLTILVIVFIGDCAFGLRSRSSSQCGVPLSQGKIIGGVDSGGYRYPWFALLLLKKNSYIPVPVCAGSLISTIHVLTAAHCFTISASIKYDDLFTVALGVYNICDDDEKTRQIFNVADVAIHERYDKKGKFYDIALIKLDRPANYVSICLPLLGVPDITEAALLIGFGMTDENSDKTVCRMLEANVTKYSKANCSASGLPPEEKKEPSIICAGALTGAVDSCYVRTTLNPLLPDCLPKTFTLTWSSLSGVFVWGGSDMGDSGGPLQTLTLDGRYVIAGIVSYGYGCGTPNVPGVYTNVGSYIQWIQNKISALGSKVSDTTKNEFGFPLLDQNQRGILRRRNSSVTFPEWPKASLPGDEKARHKANRFEGKRPTFSSYPFQRNHSVNSKRSKVSFPE